MNIGIIGTPNKDKIILPTGATVTSWGGIIYNILTLHHYLGDKGRVRPICPVGADVRDDFKSLLEKFSNIDMSAILEVPQQQNRVLLKCLNHEEKEETAQLTIPPLPSQHIEDNLAGLDFLLVNFTSGRDIAKETLRNLRDNFKKLIYVDVHSLTLSDPDARGKRRLRALHDWQEWLEGVDYVQFSWREASSLTGETTATFAGLVQVADWLLERGTAAMIVTRGEKGAFYFHTDDEGILKEEIPPFRIHNIIDTTGCGDVFSAAFISSLSQTGNTLEAAQFAVKASALKATFSGLGPWLT